MEKINGIGTKEKTLQYVSCNLCGADKTELLFTSKDLLLDKSGKFRVVKCKNCELIYLNPRPSEEAMQQYYPVQYYSYKPPKPKRERKVGIEKFFLKLNKRIKNQILQEYFNYGENPASLLERDLSIARKILLFP